MEHSIWFELGRALALVFVIEGLIPFVNPSRWRSLVDKLAVLPDQSIRVTGFISMLIGVGLLLLLK